MSGSGGRCSGARCFFRPPGRQTSVLPALMLDLSIVVIFGKSPAIREEPAPHAPGAQAHQPPTAGITGRSVPCSTMQHFCSTNGRKEVRGDKKGKIRVFLVSVETGSGPEGRKTSRHFCKVAAERAVPLPCWLQNSVWVVVATLPWCSHSHPGLGMKALSGSCHSQCLRELLRLGTEESRASRTGNQGIAVDTACPNKIKPEALAVALPLLMHTVVTLSQCPCQEWG